MFCHEASQKMPPKARKKNKYLNIKPYKEILFLKITTKNKLKNIYDNKIKLIVLTGVKINGSLNTCFDPKIWLELNVLCTRSFNILDQSRTQLVKRLSLIGIG